MKKLFTFLFAILFAMPCFADITATNGVANSATCDSGALDTDSGGAALEAQYSPETINLKWYDGNTLMNVTSTSSDACTYDSGISLPTNPTKTGYTFKGWKVRPEYDFLTLDKDIQGTNSWSKNVNGLCRYCDNKSDECTKSTEICNDTGFQDLNIGDWKVTFSYGTIYGQSRCSITYSDQYVSNSIDESNSGIYCWCRITGIIPSGQHVKHAPKQPIWILNIRRQSTDIGTDCNEQACASGCAIVINGLISHRKRAFGQ